MAYRKSSYRSGRKAGYRKARRQMNRMIPQRMRLGYRL